MADFYLFDDANRRSESEIEHNIEEKSDSYM